MRRCDYRHDIPKQKHQILKPLVQIDSCVEECRPTGLNWTKNNESLRTELRTKDKLGIKGTIVLETGSVT